MKRLACINVDLDGLRHYAAIHGLPAESLGPGGLDAVARLASDRLIDLLDKAGGLKGSFFAIGEDLRDAGGAELAGAAPLRRAANAGHEVGNHTQRHRYDLAHRPREEIFREVEQGAATIAAVIGERPTGFRAPGYTLSPEILQAAVASRHAYDSSTYPAVPYYLAKAAVMGLSSLAGRRSRAILDRARVLTAPAMPYRPDADEPYARGELPLWELPITTEPTTRVPFIGTALTSLPGPALDLLYRGVRRRPFLNLELHGVDLMDASDGAGQLLPRYQRDLAIPAARKLDRLRSIFARIADDYEVVTLRTAAERLGPHGLW